VNVTEWVGGIGIVLSSVRQRPAVRSQRVSIHNGLNDLLTVKILGSERIVTNNVMSISKQDFLFISNIYHNMIRYTNIYHNMISTVI